MARQLSQKEIEAQRIRDGRNSMADELSKVERAGRLGFGLS